MSNGTLMFGRTVNKTVRVDIVLDTINPKHFRKFSFSFTVPKKSQFMASSFDRSMRGKNQTVRCSDSHIHEAMNAIMNRLQRSLIIIGSFRSAYLYLNALEKFHAPFQRGPQVLDRNSCYLRPCTQKILTNAKNPPLSSINLSTMSQRNLLKREAIITKYSSTYSHSIGPASFLSIVHFAVSGLQRKRLRFVIPESQLTASTKKPMSHFCVS